MYKGKIWMTIIKFPMSLEMTKRVNQNKSQKKALSDYYIEKYTEYIDDLYKDINLDINKILEDPSIKKRNVKPNVKKQKKDNHSQRRV